MNNSSSGPTSLLRSLVFTAAAVCVPLSNVFGEDKNSFQDPLESTQLDPVTVRASGIEDEALFLPEVEGQKIFSAKKTSFTRLDELPSITTNNYRQAFIRTPGLNTSEVSNEGLMSINYRGIGDPHESFNVQILRDGIPISADPYGYPAAYYSPPIEAIESLEFLSGGSGLVYGPQTGGALQYNSREPAADVRFSPMTKQVFGSKGLYSTFNEVAGASDNVRYMGYFHHRQSDGFRDVNSDYDINNEHFRAVIEQSVDTTWRLSADAYQSDHGEAGGLGITSGPNQINFYDNRWGTTRGYDRLRIERYSPTFTVEHEFDKDTSLTTSAWMNFLDRYSKRQDVGSAPGFGGIAAGNNTNLTRQQFLTFGTVTRVAHHYSLAEVDNTFASGIQLINVHSPYTEKKGNHPDSESGPTQKGLVRDTFAGSLFAENLIDFGTLRITPGIRVENIAQSVDENTNATAPTQLRDTSNFSSVPLLGLGVAYEVADETDLYTNVSQGYRPTQYQDTIPLGPGDVISSDLDESQTVSYEAGIRGRPEKWFNWDTSLFLVDYDDQVGRVGNQIQNVGRAIYKGWDASSEVKLTALSDELFATELSKLGDFSLFGNVSILNAEYTRGPLDGKTPQYAPHYLAKGGITYTHDLLKLSFLGTYTGDQYGDDANNAERYIPAYHVWDLLADVKVYGDTVSITAGLNNVFDERYFSRVRGNGIDPALPRNYYGGVIVRF